MKRILPAAVVVLAATACGSTATVDVAAPELTPTTEQRSTEQRSTEQPSTEQRSGSPVALRVDRVGGFLPRGLMLTDLPDITVYADGRVLFDGPVRASHPGPALPNVQELRVAPERVAKLQRDALAAGVAETGELGMPPIADVGSTVITVDTPNGPVSRSVYALGMPAVAHDGITAEQRAARTKLDAFVTEVEKIRDARSTTYTPERLAVVASGENSATTEVRRSMAWPGPTLPGPSHDDGYGCQVLEGRQLAAVLDAAAQADAATVWRSEGKGWMVYFRPLLPDERTCEDLR